MKKNRKKRKNAYPVAGAAGGKARPLRAFCIVALLIILSQGSLAYKRNLVWGEGLALWEDSAAKSPQKARVHNNLGHASETAGFEEMALRMYSKALALKPDYTLARYNRADILMKRGLFDEAVSEFREAVRLNPGNVPGR